MCISISINHLSHLVRQETRSLPVKRPQVGTKIAKDEFTIHIIIVTFITQFNGTSAVNIKGCFMAFGKFNGLC